MSELIQIYNENMEPIGVAERSAAHATGLFHCCCHYWLIHEMDGVLYILFSRRSAKKPTYPGLLCPSASGHIPHGETWETCLELKEELGISIPADALIPLGVHIHTENRNGFANNEFVYSFIGILPCPLDSIHFPDHEVEAMVLVSIADCLALFAGRTEKVKAWLYMPTQPVLAAVSASLQDFVPDAQTADAHYYRMALYADMFTKGFPVEIPLPPNEFNPNESKTANKEIYYRDANNDEIAAAIKEIPQKCGDCSFCSSRKEYSHYDDLEGFDVYYKTIVCGANDMTLGNFRAEGSLGFDYGYEDRLLDEKPSNCPLYWR